MRLNTSGFVLVSAIVAVAGGGCASGPAYQPLSARAVVAIPGVRVARQLYSSGEDRELAVEGGGIWARGTDSQPIGAGLAKVGDLEFTGPQTLQTKFDFALYDASLRWTHFVHDTPFGYEVGAGVGVADLHLGVTTKTLPGEDSFQSPAFRLALGGLVRLRPSTRVAFGWTVLKTNSSFTDANGFQISLAQTLGRRATVQGGYSQWKLETPGVGRSAVTIKFSGPFIGFGLSF